MSFLRTRIFWTGFGATALLLSLFFAWELGTFGEVLPSLPRPEPTTNELLFTTLLVLFLSLDAGLFFWNHQYGSCPFGTKSATSLAGLLGAATLLCPACLLIPISLLGVSLSLSFLAPYLPLLRIVAAVLLLATTMMLWPKKR